MYEDSSARRHHQLVPDPVPQNDANPLEPEAPVNVVAEGVDASDSSEEEEDPEEYPPDGENREEEEGADKDSSKEEEDPDYDPYQD